MTFPIEAPLLEEIHPSLRTVITDIHGGAPPQENPFLVHMMGIPGSGKSTCADILHADLAIHAPALVGFDRIMKATSEYQAAAAQNLQAAFAQHEIPARQAGYRLVAMLLERRANFLFDHTASDQRHIPLLDYAKQLGYHIVMVHVVVMPETAKARIAERQRKENRHTPLGYVDERHTIIESLKPGFRAQVHSFHDFPNDRSYEGGVQNNPAMQRARVDIQEHISGLFKPGSRYPSTPPFAPSNS